MKECILCTNAGKPRKYFLHNKAICDKDYIAYLEFLIEDMGIQIDSDTMSDVFGEFAITLAPKLSTPEIEIQKEEPREVWAPSPYSSFGMSM